MFRRKSPRNDRIDVEDVILLFTDGHPEGTDSQDEIADANKYSKILKNERNIKIIGVAAGDVSKYRHYIESWASSPNLVFETGLTKLEVPKHVDDLVEQLKGPLCKGTGK